MTRRHGTPFSRVDLSLVIPAYNEASGIGQAIAEADQALSTLGYDFEILVVDDGSGDETSSVAQQAAAGKPRVRVLRHEGNKGYGAALRTGFEAARGRLVAFTDADCQFDLHDLGKLVPLAEPHAIAVGYRVQRQDPWLRRFVSWGYNVLARTLLGTRVRDCDCALKVFRREALAQLLPETNGFFVNTEMLTRARQLGLSVAEAGVRHRPRLRGASKVSLRDVPRTLRAFLPFWWSRVLFAGDGAVTRSENTPQAGGTFLFQFLALFLLATLLFFTKLSSPLLEPEEARYAEIPRQMLEEGSLLVPVLHGEPYYHKPPLLYWLVMGSYLLFGVEDWAARLVPGAAGVLTVLLVFLWGRRLLGHQAAFLAAVILCLSARFIYLGRMLTMDALLCLWVVAALLAAGNAVKSRGLCWRWWLLSGLCCGLGLLTKGPVALALVSVPVLMYCLLDARAPRLTLRHWAGYLAGAFLIAVPWYGAMALDDWNATTTFFLLHNVTRYVAPFDHVKPVWFFLPHLLLGLLPWSLLLFPLARFLCRKETVFVKPRPAAMGFFLIALLWCVLFYSCSGCKRPVYLLPALPLLALVLGSYLSCAIPWQTVSLRRLRLGHLPAGGASLAFWFSAGALVTGTGVCVAAVQKGLWDSSAGLLGASVLMGLLAVVFAYRKRLTAPAAWGSFVLLLFLLELGAVYHLLPNYNRSFALRGQVRRYLEWCAKEEVPVLCYPRRWDSVSFYLRHDEVQVFSETELPKMIDELREGSASLVFIKSDKALKQLLAALPGSLEFTPCGRQGKQVHVGLVHLRGLYSQSEMPVKSSAGGQTFLSAASTTCPER